METRCCLFKKRLRKLYARFFIRQCESLIDLDLSSLYYVKILIKIIQINVNKQKAFDSDPRLKQQIDFTGSLDRNGNTMLFV